MERVQVNITIPLTPPSANHYKVPTSRFMPDGRRIFEYSAEAKAWFIAVVMFSRGIHVPGKRHRIEFCVYRGRGERGDLDNYPKCIFDGLQKAGVIANDDSVVEIHGYKERDPDDPRTEICITEIE